MGRGFRAITSDVLEVGEVRPRLARTVSLGISGLVLLNVVAVMLETVPSLKRSHGAGFVAFEWFSAAIFLVEYLLRLWSAPEIDGYRSPVVGRLRFALTPMLLIDLLAIVPSLIHFGLPDLRTLRVVRLVRILRILKLGRYSVALQTLSRVGKASASKLMVSLFLVFVLLILSSSLMFYVEHSAQPEKFSSIPATMWWAMVTLTTVGYGDVFPLTPLGRFLGALIALLSVGLIALPTSILGAEFVEELQRAEGDRPFCPHCGKRVS